MVDRAGQRFGDYRLLHFLAEGTFGDVYYGEHIDKKTPVAVKVFKNKLTKNFINEASPIRFKHPNIIQIFDIGTKDDIPFLVMDYASNGTLLQQHPRGTRLPLATIVSYVKQIANGLQYAHEKGLIHRDIKPENILFGANNEVLISDFGLAVVAHNTRSLKTEDKNGTPLYMAPEQWQKHPLPASDQYALGIMVYEWLCGECPFEGDSNQLMYQHLHVLAPSLHSKVPTIALDIEQVVMKALSKDPSQRFESVLAFADSLEQACQSKALQGTPLFTYRGNTTIPLLHTHSPDRRFPPVPSHSRISRRTFVVGLAGLSALGIAGGIILRAWSQDIQSSPQGYPDANKEWQRVEGLLESRSSFTLTALTNGMALLAGGEYTGDGYADDARLFHPDTGTWKVTSPLGLGRTEHTATLLLDGRILIAGGYNGQEFLNLAELYDPSTNIWAPTGSMNQRRTHHGAVRLSNGDVLVVGGWAGGSPLTSAEIYNHQDGTWLAVDQPLLTGRLTPTCLLLPDGTVLVAGGNGLDSNSVGVTGVELFDPGTQSWVHKTEMSIGRNALGMVWLPSLKKVLCLGGKTANRLLNTVELYDPVTNQWSLTNPMHNGRALDASNNGILLEDEQVLVVGNDDLGTSEIYNPHTKIWSEPILIGQPHCQGPSVLLKGGQVLIVGNDYAFLYTHK